MFFLRKIQSRLSFPFRHVTSLLLRVDAQQAKQSLLKLHKSINPPLSIQTKRPLQRWEEEHPQQQQPQPSLYHQVTISLPLFFHRFLSFFLFLLISYFPSIFIQTHKSLNFKHSQNPFPTSMPIIRSNILLRWHHPTALILSGIQALGNPPFPFHRVQIVPSVAIFSIFTVKIFCHCGVVVIIII